MTLPHKDFLLVILVTDPARADHLLLNQLREKLPGLTRSDLKELFRKKQVWIGQRALQASSILSQGEHLVRIVDLNPEDFTDRNARPSTRGCFLPIVYEDSLLLILNKDSGTPSVPHSVQETETAVGAALAHLPSLGDWAGPHPGLEPGILHRLDTGTSGLIAFAKNQEEYLRLRSLWSSGQVRKTYRALVLASTPEALLPRLPCELKLELAHDAHSSQRMIVVSPDRKRRYRGHPLPTLTRILQAKRIDSETWDLEVEIQTGVMHQIRCTLAHLGFPILGDSVYRGGPSSRLWLHAWKLEIPSVSGERLSFEAPLPTSWAEDLRDF